MKKLLLALAALAALTACKDNGKGKLDPSAKVYINAAPTPQLAAPTRANQTALSAKEVIKQAISIRTADWRMLIDDWNRDTINDRFIVGSYYVIDGSGRLTKEFIGARDYIFVTLDEKGRTKDTIAYIQNQVMDAAEIAIEAAYAAEDYDKCYTLVQKAYTFIPTTGAAYKLLKQQGKN